MGQVKISDIRVYAYHGCLKEETAIGSDYLVDVEVSLDMEKASETDRLKDTADYVHINRIVKEEMSIPAKLLEHVSKRILDRIFDELPSIEEVEIVVSKINPPIGGDVGAVSIKQRFTR